MNKVVVLAGTVAIIGAIGLVALLSQPPNDSSRERASTATDEAAADRPVSRPDKAGSSNAAPESVVELADHAHAAAFAVEAPIADRAALASTLSGLLIAMASDDVTVVENELLSQGVLPPDRPPSMAAIRQTSWMRARPLLVQSSFDEVDLRPLGADGPFAPPPDHESVSIMSRNDDRRPSLQGTNADSRKTVELVMSGTLSHYSGDRFSGHIVFEFTHDAKGGQWVLTEQRIFGFRKGMEITPFPF